MTHTRTRTLSIGFAAFGLLSLTGCAVETASASTTNTASTYTDGTYTAEAGYQAPSGLESVTVELTVLDDVVTAVTATGDATDREAARYQERFASSISSDVVGRDLATLSVTRVAGASLTSEGFDTALEQIRSDAA